MFLSKNKKNGHTPAYPSFAIIKVGLKGVFITRTEVYVLLGHICYDTLYMSLKLV